MYLFCSGIATLCYSVRGMARLPSNRCLRIIFLVGKSVILVVFFVGFKILWFPKFTILHVLSQQKCNPLKCRWIWAKKIKVPKLRSNHYDITL